MADETIEKTATPELSKRVLDDRKDGDRLQASAREHASKIAQAVGDALGKEHGAAVAALVKALAVTTATRADAMVAADVAYTVELADDKAPRIERDKHEKVTREAIVDVRERVVGLYGSGFLSKVLLAASAPKDPKQLVTFATRAADVIAALKPESFPEAKIEGGKPSPKKWAALLSKPATALQAALDDVDREAVEAITALTKRNETRDAFEAFLPRASDLLEGLLRFGGMDAEADRLDRVVASASSGAEEPDDGGEGGGEGGGQPK
jgi:hypothetical protein